MFAPRPEAPRPMAAIAQMAMPVGFTAPVAQRPHGAIRGILFGLAIMLPVYAAAALAIILLT